MTTPIKYFLFKKFQKKCVDFNKYNILNFNKKYKENVTYLDKLKVCIIIYIFCLNDILY